MSIDVFLSYARKDRDVAEKLFNELERKGLVVWWDFGLLPGDEFAEKILNVIQLSTLTVVLWSKTSVKSRWVLSEADLADRNGSLFPVSIDEAAIPMPFSRIHSATLDRDAVPSGISELAAEISSAVLKKKETAPHISATINEENAVQAREALRTRAKEAAAEKAKEPMADHDLLDKSLHDRLEQLLSPLQKLDELSNLSAIREQAEIANARPKLPTRIFLKTVGIVGALAALVTILTYANISFPELMRGLGWKDTESEFTEPPALESAESRADVSESVLEVVTPDNCDACPEMVLLTGGTFMMGSRAAQEGHRSSEGPVHRVTIGQPFYVSTNEITVDQWRLCSAQGPCVERPEHDTLSGSSPVVYVSWEDAIVYTEWLSEITGANYRLPSESEWEYAARGGSATVFSFGDTINSDQVNFDARSVYGLGSVGEYRADITEVGSFPPNAFALHDMHGNVAEWVMDCWNASYVGKPSEALDTGLPWIEGACYRRAVRGGSWASPPVEVRSASRDFQTRTTRSAQIGFRVVRDY